MFGIGYLLAKIIDFYCLLLFIRCILSWVRVDPYSPAIRLLHQLTDPVLQPFRSMMVRSGSVAVDFSPMIALVILQMIRNFLVRF